MTPNCTDPKHLKATIDHGRSTYQIIELKTHDGLTGIGEVSDIAPRMDAPSPGSLQDIVSSVVEGGDPALEDELQALELEIADQVGSGMSALLGSTIELGPGMAAAVHLAVSSASVSMPSDLVGPGLLRDDVCATPFTLEGGELSPFEGSGLGIALDEEKLALWTG